MRNKLQKSIFVSFVLLLTIIGCRQDLMIQNEENFDANAAKFKVVKMKDIPQVSKFIRNETGRNDDLLPLKMVSQNINAKGAINFSNLETSLIIENTVDNETFYTFDITNAGDDKTIYNLEVKETNGTVVNARVIEYASNVAFGNNPVQVLSNFTGTAKAFGLDGSLESGISYTIGEGPCDDPPNPGTGTPGSGTPGGGSDGGGVNPPIGGNPDPSNPLPPNYVGGGSGGFSGGNGGSSGGSGSSSGGSSSVGSANDDEKCPDKWIRSHHVTIDGQKYDVYVNCKKDATKLVPVQSFSSKIKPGCDDDGSGVIVLPGGSPITDTPCDKLKDIFATDKANVKGLITAGMYDYINNSSNGEAGIYMKKDANGVLTNEVAPYTGTPFLPAKYDGDYYSTIHTHPKTTYPMFSYSDLIVLYKLEVDAAPHNKKQSSFILVCEDDDGVKQTYAVVFESSGLFMEDIWDMPKFLGCNIEEKIKELNEDLKEMYDNEVKKADTNPNYKPNYERAFLQFCFGTNIGLYKANDDLSNWSKLAISENSETATLKPKNCN